MLIVYWTQKYLNPHSTVRLKKLIVAQLVKKFPTFFGTQVFVTSFTRSRHLSLSWSRPIQSTSSHPTSWRFVLILTSHLGLVFPAELTRCVPRSIFSYNSWVPVVSRAAGVDMEPVKVGNVTRGGKGKYMFALTASGSVSKNFFWRHRTMVLYY